MMMMMMMDDNVHYRDDNNDDEAKVPTYEKGHIVHHQQSSVPVAHSDQTHCEMKIDSYDDDDDDDENCFH